MRIKSVLVIDDDDISNHITKCAIEKIQFADEITIRTDAVQALTYLELDCCLTNNYPTLILLDLKMPEMDGFGFLEKFNRLRDTIKQPMVVVVLTNSKDDEDLLKLRELGDLWRVSKPLTTDKLSEIFQRYFKGKFIIY